MYRFTNLRMTGFKSFVEPTDFEIHDGLTGIVGPNGCGKSNVLEALRWVMGATSAKALRGDGMDSVIFSGTSMRPKRNWAEVTLSLDNSARQAPADFNDCNTIEITRRILRKDDGSQSIYRINNRDVRARDVQLFFADASSGANSPALVRQGQIAELINAKPQNRRRLLEEAAGITGLHSRRHEAELRLRAAETNLERLDDVMGELETRKGALARQARQATRYRNLSGDIRRAEAMAAYLRWRDATDAAEAIMVEQAEIKTLVEETTLAASRANAAREEAKTALDPLRQAEAEAAAALHRLTVAQENLEAEADRAAREIERLKAEQTQLRNDIAREKTLNSDADEAIETLNREQQGLRQREHSEAARLTAAEGAMQAAAKALSTAEQTFEEKSTEAAKLEAGRNAAETRVKDLEARKARLVSQIETLEREHADLVTEADLDAALGKARSDLERASDHVALADAAQTRAEQERSTAEGAEIAARGPVRDAERAVSEIEAEAEAIRRILDDNTDGRAVLEDVTVEPGYENALAAALGDDLNATTDPNTPAHWSVHGRVSMIDGQAPVLPDGVLSLRGYVRAPAELGKRLAQIGVVAREIGDRLQMQLVPGQRLVSREGDLWRWDGYVARAEARTPAAIRLEQRNRLQALSTETETAHDTLRAAQLTHRETLERLETAKTLASESRQAFGIAHRQAEKTRTTFAALERDFERASTKLTALSERITQQCEERDAISAALSQATEQVANLPDSTILTNAVSTARSDLAEARTCASEARSAFNDLSREAESRTKRLTELGHERGVWASRGETATKRISELETRLQTIMSGLENAEGAPDAIAAKRDMLLTQITAAETRRNDSAGALARAQSEAAEGEKLNREAEAAANEAREARARVEAQAEAAVARVEEAIALARENCEAAPDALLSIAEHMDEKPLPTREEIDKKLERYKRERENLGGVNLRADEELEEIATRLEEFTTEREDCEAAIKKLRGSITNINREARQRLLDAFETVNENFVRLFTTLFNGGEAELKLVDDEDPLEAGLEIYACPPGKKLISMSLMSGGEQALTATALIFAVFLANPAPVCVLDEVDAPLDDANTERFCQMLHEMAQHGQTRFVIITHHPLTMSRMDRLFGVTMIERGVSQLVSVDLSRAEQLAAAE